MHYKAHATAGAKPQVFHDSEGEPVEGSRLEVLCAAHSDPKLRSRLTAAEIAEVETHLSEIQAEIPPRANPHKASHLAQAKCGKSFSKPTLGRAKAAVRFHARKCKACAEA